MRVIIIGAGGHAQVVADVLLRAHEHGSEAEPIGYVDDDPSLAGKTPINLPVLGALEVLSSIPHESIIIAVGDNATRKRLSIQLYRRGERLTTACHPSAVVAPDVQIGCGTMICAGVVINPGSVIGDSVILNTACTVDHHGHVADYAHLAPGVHLGGEVTVGEGALMGISSVAMPRTQIGTWSIVGAGALVQKSIPNGSTAVGVPARIISTKK